MSRNFSPYFSNKTSQFSRWNDSDAFSAEYWKELAIVGVGEALCALIAVIDTE